MRGMWEPVLARDKRVAEAATIAVITILIFLYNWNREAVDITHIYPTMEKVNIYDMVKRRDLAAPQIRLIAEQTGVNEVTIKNLLKQGYWQQVLELQEAYFAPVHIKSVKSSPLTISEYLVDGQGKYVKGTQIVDVEDGDILITKNSRFLGWRNGHVGIVVDAEKGRVLEAIMLGTDTKLCRLEKWEEYPSFMVLRLKEEVGEQWQVQGMRPAKAVDDVWGKESGTSSITQMVSDYAAEYLIDIPYRLLAGVGDRVFQRKMVTIHAAEQDDITIPTIKGTQCAHLVWYAYKQVGIDLDSDGGIFVTPNDIQNSPYLEVIQSYGY